MALLKPLASARRCSCTYSCCTRTQPHAFARYAIGHPANLAAAREWKCFRAPVRLFAVVVQPHHQRLFELLRLPEGRVDAEAHRPPRKGKKGKREKEQEPAWRLALSKSINAFLALLTALKTSLKKDQLDEDAPAELPEASVLPEDDSRVEVAKLLGTARRVSLDRLLGVCGDKLAALQGRIR